MTSDVKIKAGAQYRVEIEGKVVEQFVAGRSTDLAIRCGSDMQSADVVELPRGYHDPNATQFTTITPIVQGLLPLRRGFADLLAKDGPPNGQYQMVYAHKNIVITVGIGADADEL